MYADVRTGSIGAAIAETERRRAIQEVYNREHGITPASIVKDIDEVLGSVYERDYMSVPSVREAPEPYMSLAEIDARIQQLNRDMKAAAANLEFEKAASIRDEIKRLRARSLGVDDVSVISSRGLDGAAG
jgi:excinuclease ABC subunit B